MFLNGVVKFDGTTWTNYTELNSGLPDSYLNLVAIDASDNKWVGTTYAGVAAFNENGVNSSIGESPVSRQFIKVFPNPADDHLTVESDASSCIDRIEILSMSGNLVLTRTLKN